MKSINLLPPEEQALLRKEKMLALVRAAAFVMLGSYVLVFLILVGMRIYEVQNVNGIENQITNLKAVISKQDNSVLKLQIQNSNNIIQDYNTLSDSNPRWSSVVKEFARIVPADVAVQSFSASAKDGKIDVVGKSQTRSSVLQLRTNILNSAFFQKVDLPLDNIAKPNNLDFHYTFYLQDKILLK